MVTKFGPDVQPEWRPIEAAFDGEAKFMKVMNFSPDGNQFAYSDGKKVYHYTLIKVSFYLQRQRRSLPVSSCCCCCCGEKFEIMA